jgi:tripartite-type tricarboxylate transporter receptor subunit TctC
MIIQPDPIKIVVGFAAGGAVDIVARLIAQWLSERIGQQCVVENRPGAGNNIATLDCVGINTAAAGALRPARERFIPVTFATQASLWLSHRDSE